MRYYGKWPYRLYSLLPQSFSLNSVTGSDGVLRVFFVYRFNVANSSNRRAGRASTTLELLPKDRDRFIIVSEDGKVLAGE